MSRTAHRPGHDSYRGNSRYCSGGLFHLYFPYQFTRLADWIKFDSPREIHCMPSKIKPDKTVFDQMAPGWYSFRHYSIFRPELEELAARWKKGRLLNIGCGHGPDFLPFRGGFDLYGLDFSPEMIKMARRYSHKFEFPVNLMVADARFLPFGDNSFEWAIAVASYHHLKGQNEQLSALRELRRVLKPGAEAFLTVWNRWQPRFWLAGKETLVPWKTRGQVVQRYYYLFSYSGFERLVKKAGFQVLNSFAENRYHFPLKYFSRNICLLIQKPAGTPTLPLDGRRPG
jgi:tRNA (uracil-5-)-methyltransferase TRM9